MADSTKKREPKKNDPVPPILKTDDEIMDDLFSPEVREKLKDLARDNRKPKKDD